MVIIFILHITFLESHFDVRSDFITTYQNSLVTYLTRIYRFINSLNRHKKYKIIQNKIT